MDLSDKIALSMAIFPLTDRPASELHFALSA
jgi:hypothetical protein